MEAHRLGPTRRGARLEPGVRRPEGAAEERDVTDEPSRQRERALLHGGAVRGGAALELRRSRCREGEGGVEEGAGECELLRHAERGGVRVEDVGNKLQSRHDLRQVPAESTHGLRRLVAAVGGVPPRRTLAHPWSPSGGGAAVAEAGRVDAAGWQQPLAQRYTRAGDHAQSSEAVGRAAIGTAARGALVLTTIRNLEVQTEGDLAAELRAWEEVLQRGGELLRLHEHGHPGDGGEANHPWAIQPRPGATKVVVDG
eukprot:scaffold16732_cov55-Phaeocystis_antarctica.AAC.2